MPYKWSPHPRYRLYTSPASYGLGLKQYLNIHRCADSTTELLEDEICRRFNINAAACAPMARTGIYFGLRELIKPGQTVILSPLNLVDVVNMVILAGGVPVFTDIIRRTCSIDPDQAESQIDHRTGAVLITHLHGATAGAHVFKDICKRKGIPLIEDAAQAFGTVENGRHLGSIGDLGVYSFGFYKNVNSWRGGMVVSPNRDLIARIRRSMDKLTELSLSHLMALGLRGLFTDAVTWPPLFATLVHPVLRKAFWSDWAIVNRQLDPENRATRISAIPSKYLYRMNSYQLTLVLNRLEYIERDAAARLDRAYRYYQAIGNLEMLIAPEWQNDKSNTYTYYPIQCRQRDALLRYALHRNRDFAAQHLRNCADLPEFREFYRDCPNARAAARELILLPTYPRYPFSEIEKNNNVILDFFSAAR